MEVKRTREVRGYKNSKVGREDKKRTGCRVGEGENGGKWMMKEVEEGDKLMTKGIKER